MTPDPFPSELVEAAACAITTSGRRGSTDQEAQAYDAAYAVLAAVVPLIEQRVIDRLAGEAGENPYRDLSMPLLSEACKIEAEVWDAGAACGVAAERARMLSPESLKVAAKALCHQWRKGESYEDRARAAIAAALAPERTGEGNDA